MFFIALLALGGVAQELLLLKEQRDVQSMKEKLNRLDATAKIAGLEFQEKCAKQAKEEFKTEGYTQDDFATYTNHYNPKLNKCFAVIESTRQNPLTASKILVDPFEGKVYGDYIWTNPDRKKFWEVSPSECKVTLPSGEEKQCRSSDEFEDLVKQYMD